MIPGIKGPKGIQAMKYNPVQSTLIYVDYQGSGIILNQVSVNKKITPLDIEASYVF